MDVTSVSDIYMAGCTESNFSNNKCLMLHTYTMYN